MIKITVVECIIEMLGKVIATLKMPPTITVSVYYYNYKLAELSTSGLGRFLECLKCA